MFLNYITNTSGKLLLVRHILLGRRSSHRLPDIFTDMRFSCCLLLVGFISASQIIFTAKPRNISPVLSPTLHLRCSLKSGESLDADTLTAHTLFPKTKLFHKPQTSNVLHVVSILIYKSNNITGTNKTVASVTSFDPATAEDLHAGETIVTGNTQLSDTGEQGYLEVTRVSPNSKDAGTYVCQVSALNHAKYPVSFTAFQQITASEPTVVDIVQYVETNNMNIAELKHDINALTSAITRRKIQHIQTGLLQCAGTSQDAFISFPVPFNSTPQVVTALASLSKLRDYYNSYSDTTVTATAKRVNMTGFFVSCQAATTTFNFTWIAIGDQM